MTKLTRIKIFLGIFPEFGMLKKIFLHKFVDLRTYVMIYKMMVGVKLIIIIIITIVSPNWVF